MIHNGIYPRPYQVSDQRVEVLVQDGEVAKLLYFEASQPICKESLLNDDSPLIVLAQYCSSKGKNLLIEGSITKFALIHMEEFIQIWSVWRPDLFSRIRIDAAKNLDDVPNRDLPSVLAFSGGVDASFALAIHKNKKLGWLNRDIRLSVMIVGYDRKEDDPGAVDNAFASIESTLSFNLAYRQLT